MKVTSIVTSLSGKENSLYFLPKLKFNYKLYKDAKIIITNILFFSNFTNIKNKSNKNTKNKTIIMLGDNNLFSIIIIINM